MRQAIEEKVEIEVAECDNDSGASIHTIHHKHYTRDPIYMEWVMAAMVLDRLFLFVFIFVTLVLTITVVADHPSDVSLHARGFWATQLTAWRSTVSNHFWFVYAIMTVTDCNRNHWNIQINDSGIMVIKKTIYFIIYYASTLFYLVFHVTVYINKINHLISVILCPFVIFWWCKVPWFHQCSSLSSVSSICKDATMVSVKMGQWLVCKNCFGFWGGGVV